MFIFKDLDRFEVKIEDSKNMEGGRGLRFYYTSVPLKLYLEKNLMTSVLKV